MLADVTLKRLEVDGLGLDSSDRRYLKFIAEHSDGGPVGVETIAAALSEARDTIGKPSSRFCCSWASPAHPARAGDDGDSVQAFGAECSEEAGDGGAIGLLDEET